MKGRIEAGEEGASLHNKGYVATTEHQSTTIMTSIYEADGNRVPIYGVA